MPYLYFWIAIMSEVVATSTLKATQEFTRLGPSIVCLIDYDIALFGLNLSLRTIPVGIAYAVWAGLGTALVVLVGVVLYQQKLDLPAVLGIGLIIAGVAVINVWSNVLAE